MALNIKPTRSELIKLKKRIKLAKSGHGLLKKKRDGLILEFFEILKKAKSQRKDLVATYATARKKMAIARTVDFDLQLKAMSLAVAQPVVELEQKNIMGLRVPKIKHEGEIEKKLLTRNFGIITGSARIDEAVEGYEKVLKSVIAIAETETTMKRLLQEIETTKRRVNALEFAVIPQLDEVKSFITLRLEEMERENIFRMKRIKAKA